MAAEAAPTALVVATRAAVGGCGPGHVLAPQRTALDDGQGQGGGRELNFTAAFRLMPSPRRLVSSTFAMNADEDEGVAPAAERPAPFPEVLPQAGLGRHGGVGYELVLANAVPQLGVELDAKQHLVARVVSLWSQGVPEDWLLQEALSGNKDRVELEEKDEVREKEKAKTRVTEVTAAAPERKSGKETRVIPPRRISERIEQQIADVPVQRSPQTRTSERIQEQTVVPGLQSIPQKLTSKRIVAQNADVSEPQVIPQKRISKRTVEQNAEDSVPQVIPQKRISERIVEQNVDDSVQIIPQERTLERIQAPHMSSWTLRSGWGIGFSHFSPSKKSATSTPQSSANLLSHSSSWPPAPYGQGQPSKGEIEYIKYGGSWWGRRWDPERQQFSWRMADRTGYLYSPDFWVLPWELDFVRRLGGGG